MDSPSTCSITKYGVPSSRSPLSIRRAMEGWARVARMCRSLCSRLRRRGCRAAWCSTLMATVCSVLGIVALAAIDGAHAAMAEDGDDAVVADARTHQTVLMLHQQRFRRLADGVHQRVLGALVRGQQRLDRTLELAVASAGACQAGGLLPGRRIDHLVEQRLDLLPAPAQGSCGRVSCDFLHAATRVQAGCRGARSRSRRRSRRQSDRRSGRRSSTAR